MELAVVQVESVHDFQPFGRSVVSSLPFASGVSAKNEKWILSSVEDSNDYEIEVYWANCTVVVSHCCFATGQCVLQKTYSVDTEIKDVLWAKFSLSQKSEDDATNCLCVLEQEFLSIFSDDGSSFASALPFRVKHIWPMRRGICVERDVTPNETEEKKSMPTLFSLTNPLDDFKPIVYRYQDGFKPMYFTDFTQQVVYSNSEPQFLMTYDAGLGLHSIWIARKATEVDIPDASHTDVLPEFSNVANLTWRDQLRMSLSPAISKRHSCPPAPLAASKRQSPGRNGHQPVVNSPLVNLQQMAGSHSKGTPRPVHSAHDGSYNPSPLSRLSSPNMFRMSYEESFVDEDQEPLPPDMCLEQVWEEEDVFRHGKKGKSKKCFLTRDFCGQAYLAYVVVGLARLRLLKVELSQNGRISFQKAAEFQYVDAGPIEGACLMVAMDTSQNIILLSGKQKIAQILFEDIIGAGAMIPEVMLRDFTSRGFTVKREQACSWVRLPVLTLNNKVSLCLKALENILPTDDVVSVYGKYYNLLHGESKHYFDNQSCGDWSVFVRASLKNFGFAESATRIFKEKLNSPTPPLAKKAKKSDSMLGLEDWEYLVAQQTDVLLLETLRHSREGSPQFIADIRLQKNAPLYSYLPQVFSAWHDIYEELKLISLEAPHLLPFAKMLHFLAKLMHLDHHTSVYETDFPYLITHSDTVNDVGEDPLEVPASLKSMTLSECSTYHKVLDALLHNSKLPLATDRKIHKLSLGLIKTFDRISEIIAGLQGKAPEVLLAELCINQPDSSCLLLAQKVIEDLSLAGFRPEDVDLLPLGYQIVIKELIYFYKMSGHCKISPEATAFLGREDLVSLKQADPSSVDVEFEEILKFRFSQDLRINEVKSLLDTSKPVVIKLVQKVDVNDHAFAKEEEALLALICKRTMAVPVARGMFMLGTSKPIASKTVTIPTLDLTGKSASSSKVIQIFQSEPLAARQMWPFFHNGVAAGLEYVSDSSKIDSTWIIFNKLRGSDVTAAHSGFLLALGLTGHLQALPKLHLHDYLIKGHDLTSAALLLGISATKIGSKDASTYKLLSLHLDSLLPPTALELSIPQSAQVAALVSVGLLYYNSADIHLVKVLLYEIGRPPGPEMENSTDRESHALGAGLALGMLLIGHGGNVAAVADVNVSDMLYHYIYGGKRKPLPPSLQEKYKTASYQIHEGELVNTNATLPAACMAVALIYLKTNNATIADWLSPVMSQSVMDSIKPDHLLLKSLAHSLVMWDELVPVEEWLNSYMNETQYNSLVNADVPVDTDDRWYITYLVCLVAGKCLGLGIKFAGSANNQAFQLLFPWIGRVKSLTTATALDEVGARPVLEMCLDTILISVSLVMAGTGNLQVLRVARQLRKRCSAEVSYGDHMAVHMAIGFLFLGGGRYALKTDNLSIAALLCAVYPKWPNTCKDNQFHLQALRHLYVLASEKRLVVTRDIDTKKICYSPVKVTLKETPSYPETDITLVAPCFVPELHLIKQISIVGPRYWPIVVDLSTESERNSLLRKLDRIYVKKKSGYLSYSEDPKGHRNLLARTFTNQADKLDLIKSFNSSAPVLLFAETFCRPSRLDVKQVASCELYANILYECVTMEKLDVLTVYLEIERILERATLGQSSVTDIQQLALLFIFYKETYPKLLRLGCVHKSPLLDPVYVSQARLKMHRAMDTVHQDGDGSTAADVAARCYRDVMRLVR